VRVDAIALVAWAALALAACAQAVPETTRAPAPPSAAPTPPQAPAPSSTAPVGAEGLPSLEALAARGPSVAPGMREAARGEIVTASGAAERSLVRADLADACVRVTLVAQPAVHAWLTDTRGDRLTDVNDATSALLAPLGPVCIRKGDAVTLHVEAQAPHAARFVAWTSP
jgi:hypothetical protein